MSKTKANRIHAKRRAKSRYGLNLNRIDIQAIVKLIQSDGHISSKKLTNTRSEKILLYKDLFLRCVYCKTTKTIVTFLPIRYGPKQL